MEKKTGSLPIVVSVVGVESSGKTTLTESLSKHYSAPLVTEYARSYLNSNGPNYKEEDLYRIAVGQNELVKNAISDTSNLVICDTNILVIIIWSIYRFNRCDPRIIELYKNLRTDINLLTDFNIPWAPDPLRESPDIQERQKIHNIYLELLKEYNQPCQLLIGNEHDRFKKAVSVINTHLEREAS